MESCAGEPLVAESTDDLTQLPQAPGTEAAGSAGHGLDAPAAESLCWAELETQPAAPGEAQAHAEGLAELPSAPTLEPASAAQPEVATEELATQLAAGDNQAAVALENPDAQLLALQSDSRELALQNIVAAGKANSSTHHAAWAQFVYLAKTKKLPTQMSHQFKTKSSRLDVFNCFCNAPRIWCGVKPC